MAPVDSRVESIKKYFIITPKSPSYLNEIVYMVLGGIIFFAGLIFGANDNNSFCVGAGFVCALIVAGKGGLDYLSKKSAYDKAYGVAEPKPSDAQMDRWLEQDTKQIIQSALGKLDLASDQVLNINEPLVVTGPKTRALIALGKDGILRFSEYKIVVIYLTNYHLGAYEADLDFITGKVVIEETQEYHYTDIVSVATVHENTPFTAKTPAGREEQIALQQQFALTVASGDKIQVTVALPQLKGVFETGKLLPSGAEKAMSTLRAMLREKKGGTQ